MLQYAKITVAILSQIFCGNNYIPPHQIVAPIEKQLNEASGLLKIKFETIYLNCNKFDAEIININHDTSTVRKW